MRHATIFALFAIGFLSLQCKETPQPKERFYATSSGVEIPYSLLSDPKRVITIRRNIEQANAHQEKESFEKDLKHFQRTCMTAEQRWKFRIEIRKLEVRVAAMESYFRDRHQEMTDE